jgi:hypothetical protein
MASKIISYSNHTSTCTGTSTGTGTVDQIVAATVCYGVRVLLDCIHTKFEVYFQSVLSYVQGTSTEIYVVF